VGSATGIDQSGTGSSSRSATRSGARRLPLESMTAELSKVHSGVMVQPDSTVDQ